MSLDSALSVATSGVLNIDAQMAVISNNVANSGTAGYAVESQQQTDLLAGNVGEGVYTGLVVRGIDLQQQSDVFAQNAVVSGLQTAQAALTPIGATQGVTGAGNDLASLLGQLQDSFTTLSSDPSNVAQQSAVVDAAQTLTNGINTLAASYSTARQNAQDGISTAVTTLNQALDTVGQLNDQIIAAKGANQSVAPFENLRDAALQTISSLLSVQVTHQSNGAVLLTTASGLTLPTPGTTDQNQSPFSTTDVSLSPSDTTGSGVPQITLGGQDVTAKLKGGTLGANITLRDTTLPTYQAALDEFTENLATRFSGQGLSLFTQPDGSIPSQSGTPVQADYVGFSNSVTVNPAVTADPALVRDGNVTVAGSATGAAAFTPNPAGGPAGFTTLVNNIVNYSFGADAQQGVAWPGFATSGLGISGTLSTTLGATPTLADYAAQLVSSQAQDQGQVSSQLTDEQAVQTTLGTQLQNTAGVNIDTQLSAMVQLQNAYGANAKILQAIQAMYTTLDAAVT